MNFNFGRRKTEIFQYAIIGISLVSVVGTLSECTHIPEDIIYKAIDSIQRRIAPGSRLNDYFIRDPHLLDLRVKGDVDNAIRNYEKWERQHRTINMKNKNILKEIQKSKYTDTQRTIVENAIYYEFAPDTSKAQELLGPTMGIRSLWVSPDPREIKD
jgi:hypothetical protein